MKHEIENQKENAAKWYDNPDISDLLFSMLSMGKDSKGICLLNYDRKTGKGLKNFIKNESNWSASKVDSLKNEIVYHPILTISTHDIEQVRKYFIDILDGIDGINGDNGLPKAIIIPILMHYNHFGTIVIQPGVNQTEISYFNSLGTLSSYSDEEKIIFGILNTRYNLQMDENFKSEYLKYNNSQRWQNDSNQCGPYTINFVNDVVTSLKSNPNSNIGELLTKRYVMGINKDEGEVKDGGKALKLALENRQTHATFVSKQMTNFSVHLFIQFQKMIRDDPKWFDKEIKFDVCPNIGFVEAQNKKVKFNEVEITQFKGSIDAFELPTSYC